MPILVVCPGCGAKMNAPDSAAGRKVRCPKPDCKSVVTVPAVAPAAPPPPAPAERDPDPFSGLGGDDARPRGRSRRDDDDRDDRPRGRRDEDDDRPRSRRRDDEDDRPRGRRDERDEEDRPRRGRRDEGEDDDRPRGRRGEDEDDRPRGRRRDEDDEGDRPRRRDDDDYDDRPQRGRPRGKPGGKKTGLIIALVVGAVVLLGGGGYLVYRMVGGSKAAVPPGWKEYTSAEDGFKGYFPKDVVKLGAGIPAGAGGFDLPGLGKGGTTSVYSSGAPSDPVQVQVVVTRMPGGIPKEMREMMAKLGDLQKEMQKALGPGSGPEIRSVKWLGEQATEMVGPNEVVRTAMTANAIYQARVSGPKNTRAKAEDEAAFFDNFTLTK
ncbi:MAG: hypothetical protein C0501_23975 [Isosphaera sp.]|nr:hypothetical protein [Isosphaera sp.]